MKKFYYSLFVCTLSILSSCSTIVETGRTVLAPVPIFLQSADHFFDEFSSSGKLNDEIPVFIFSNRKLKDEQDSKQSVVPYTNERDGSGYPNLSKATVAIGVENPEDLQLASDGRRKREDIKLRLEDIELYERYKNTDYKQIVSGKKLPKLGKWMQDLKDELDKSKSRKVTIYVHGYNTHFVQNTELCASLFHYTGRDGVIINFDWPSQGRLVGYFQDKGNATYSVLYLRLLLSRLAVDADAKRINIIGHSAGCPIVVNALKELRLIEFDKSEKELAERYRIGGVALAAPDMDKMTFYNAVFDRFYEVTDGVAVYVSPYDKALRASSVLFSQARLGRSDEELNEGARNIDSSVHKLHRVQVSAISTGFSSFLGHSYFYEDPWVASDLHLHLKGFSPEKRGLIPTDRKGKWTFPGNYPERVADLLEKKTKATEVQLR